MKNVNYAGQAEDNLKHFFTCDRLKHLHVKSEELLWNYLRNLNIGITHLPNPIEWSVSQSLADPTIIDLVTKKWISKRYLLCLLSRYITNTWPIVFNNTRFVEYAKELLHSNHWKKNQDFGSLPNDLLNIIQRQFNIFTEVCSDELT